MPEDKAPDMPLLPCPFCPDGGSPFRRHDEFTSRHCPDSPFVRCERCHARAISAEMWNTRTIQSPDQGAVEEDSILKDLRKLSAFARSTDDNIPFHHIGTINMLTARIEQALTRPPLDLAGLRRNAYSPIDNTYLNNQHGGWNACLDHLQAIRPDLFGGKK